MRHSGPRSNPKQPLKGQVRPNPKGPAPNDPVAAMGMKLFEKVSSLHQGDRSVTAKITGMILNAHKDDLVECEKLVQNRDALKLTVDEALRTLAKSGQKA